MNLPPMLVDHIAQIERGLTGGASGPTKAEARESLKVVIKALVGARGRAQAALAALEKERVRL